MLPPRFLLALALLSSVACSRTPPAARAPGVSEASAPGKLEAPSVDLKVAAQGLGGQLSDCYGRALLDRPDTEVELTYALVLASNGQVVGMSLDPRGTCGQFFLRCVETALRRLRFAPSPNGPLAVVRGQLSFAPRAD